MVLFNGLRLVAAGSAIGLVCGFAFSSILANRIAGVSVTDPLTFGAVATIVVAVGLTACVLPARQATRVDPLIALRSE